MRGQGAIDPGDDGINRAAGLVLRRYDTSPSNKYTDLKLAHAPRKTRGKAHFSRSVF